MRDDDPKTIWAMKIKRKNKRTLVEIMQAFTIIGALAVFFLVFWLVGEYIKKQGW